MLKFINFIDKAEEMLFVEEEHSLSDTLGKDFKKIYKKFFYDFDKRIFDFPIERLYKDFVKTYGPFDDIKLDDLIEELSLDKDDELVKKYEKEYFNIKTISIWEEDAEFACFIVDTERSVYEGIEKLISVGKDSFKFAFNIDGNPYAMIFIKL